MILDVKGRYKAIGGTVTCRINSLKEDGRIVNFTTEKLPITEERSYAHFCEFWERIPEEPAAPKVGG